MKILTLFIFSLFIFSSLSLRAQENNNRSKILQQNKDVFGRSAGFIENIGQYGDTLPRYGYMGKILSTYEGFGMPVLFTTKGMIYMQRETKLKSYEAVKREERRKKRKGEKTEKFVYTDKIVTMEWVNANPNPELLFENSSPVSHSYGTFTKPARGFGKITYKNLYPGIDIQYSFVPDREPGFEYQVIAQPGADISLIKMKYGGDLVKLSKGGKGNIVVKSAIETIDQTSPFAFSESVQTGRKVDIGFKTDRNTVSFKLRGSYDLSKKLIIDPFVSSTSNFTGTNALKAKDIDFDYAGNVYVGGGGTSSVQMLAKYDPTGTLLWTFSGSLPSPAWTFGPSYGGWVVDKSSQAVYMGQGLTSGWRVIRINAAGLYDNYITTANANFTENWKMIYGCKSGISTIMAAGGGGSANNELALIAPPSLVPTVSNLSGLTGGHNDISDIVLDPLTDDLFSIYSTPVTGIPGDNTIYKHTPPHTAATKAWSITTGLNALREPSNRPYMSSLDNSSNVLAINGTYLFYWDGKNLRAYNKSTGLMVGTGLTIATATNLASGGVYADECNNVFVGSTTGTIKAYRFDGTSFDDNAVADLTITGMTGAVYDLAFDNGKKLLYASGNGFVAALDLSAVCPSQVYTLTVVADCSTASATATIAPLPGSNVTVSYALFTGSTQVASNSTGIFTGLSAGTNYTVTAYLNQACGGPQTSVDFVLSGVPNVLITDPPAKCVPFTTDLTDPAITAGSTPGLTFTYWADAAATTPVTNPTSVIGGTYYIKGSTAAGCNKVSPVNVAISPAPPANAGPDQAICNRTNTQLQGSGGVSYQWSPVTYLSDPAIPNPMLIQAPPGTHKYLLTITDPAGCISTTPDTVEIVVHRPAKLHLPMDTAIIVNQPLHLIPVDVNSVGFNNYVWSPTLGLSDPYIKDPIATISSNIVYTVSATSPGSCPGSAQIRVTVYKQPEIYVPSAFSPNQNGVNDILRAIPVGIRTFKYFRVFNRYGELIFSTKNPSVGWDGKIGGVQQSSGVYVWTAEAEDYTGTKLFRKGTTTIIR